MAIRRVAVVMNGRAGALLGNSDPHGALTTALTEAGLQADIIPDTADLPERIKMAAECGADAVVVAGGDGTVACAAQVLAGGNLPLGILPFGTMNLLAKDLRLPIGDLPAALRVIAAGQVRAIDVGEVNGHMFLCASMLGLPVRLGRYREGVRKSGKLWRMVIAASRLLIRRAPVSFTVEVGGASLKFRAMTVTITVNPLDEASGLAFARATLDSGTLCAHIVRPRGLSDYLGLPLRLVAGQWRQARAVEERPAPALTIGAYPRAMQVMNDGEISLLTTPLHYRVRPAALSVLVPPEHT